MARSTALAREQGKRVEVLSERTESSTTWANVNGSFTTSTFDGPVRIKDADAADGWRDLDYDLVKQDDGSFAPKSGYVPLELSGATTAAESEGNPVVSLTGRDSTDLGFGWDGALPEPRIDGDKATYSNVQPNIDLVVQLTAKGFEQSFVLKSKPAAGTDTSLELPLIADGVDATEGSTGAVALTDSDHKSVGTIPTPYMWDSTGANGSAEPNTAKLPVAVVDQADGTQTLVLTPTRSFLNDPDTKYPVIIDPVIQPYNPAFDTYVQSNMTTTNFSTSTELHVGVQTDGGAVTRSYLNFDAREFQGYVVTYALLTLYQTQSTTCTATPMTVTASELANANTRWPAQPGNNTSQTATVSASKGYSTACPAGSFGADVTGLTNFLASQNTPTIGMRLTASETLRSGWKNINSADNTLHKPNLQVTYNRPPGTAATPTVSPIKKYDGSAAYANSTILTFGSSVTDPDGSNTLVRYEVYRASDTAATNLIGGCDSGGVASGALATCIFHNTFPASDTYYVRALGQDGQLWSKAWSGLTAFNVGIDAPELPYIDCLNFSGLPPSDNGATIPLPPQELACGVSASYLGKSSSGVNIRARVDNGVVQSLDILPGAGGTLNVWIPRTAGAHTISASVTNAMGITSVAGFGITFGPAAPTSLGLSPWDDPDQSGFATSSTPTLAAAVTGSATTLTADFEIHNSTAGSSASLKASCTSAIAVANGQLAKCAVSTALADGQYYLRSRTHDGSLVSVWSAWKSFSVNNIISAYAVMDTLANADDFNLAVTALSARDRALVLSYGLISAGEQAETPELQAAAAAAQAIWEDDDTPMLDVGSNYVLPGVDVGNQPDIASVMSAAPDLIVQDVATARLKPEEVDDRSSILDTGRVAERAEGLEAVWVPSMVDEKAADWEAGLADIVDDPNYEPFTDNDLVVSSWDKVEVEGQTAHAYLEGHETFTSADGSSTVTEDKQYQVTLERTNANDAGWMMADLVNATTPDPAETEPDPSSEQSTQPPTPDAQRSTASASTFAAVATAKGPAHPSITINRDKVVKYAQNYSCNSNASQQVQHCYNKRFDHFGGEDCTNFASQAINAGGMPQVLDTNANANVPKWYNVKRPDPSTLFTVSKTWTSNTLFVKYMVDSMHYAVVKKLDKTKPVSGAQRGDIYLYDFEGDGETDHLAVALGDGTFADFYDTHNKKNFRIITTQGSMMSQHAYDRIDAPWNWGWITEKNVDKKRKSIYRVVHFNY